jgi:hypothetical protein
MVNNRQQDTSYPAAQLLFLKNKTLKNQKKTIKESLVKLKNKKNRIFA